jgi:hypothetical protein
VSTITAVTGADDRVPKHDPVLLGDPRDVRPRRRHASSRGIVSLHSCRRLSSRTLPALATAVVSNERGIEWGTLNAMGSLVLLPVMALAVQRHIVKGMTMGAVKG